jgi:hypothetical protein
MKALQNSAGRSVPEGAALGRILLAGLAGLCLLRLYPGMSLILDAARMAMPALARSWSWASPADPLIFAAADLELSTGDLEPASKAQLAEANGRTWDWDGAEVTRLSSVARVMSRGLSAMSPGAPAVMIGLTSTNNLNIYLGLACLMTPAFYASVPPLTAESLPSGDGWRRLTLIFGEPGVPASVRARIAETHALRFEDGAFSVWSPSR